MSLRRLRLAVAVVALSTVGILAAQAVAAPGAQAPARPAQPASALSVPTLEGYVALGDSYSSGEGAGSYTPDSDNAENTCHRSVNAYPPELNADKALGTLTFRACSGATTSDLVEPNHDGNIDVSTGVSEAAQLSFLRTDTKDVTLTIGGNDLGFSSAIRQCVSATYLRFTVAGGHGCAGNSSLLEALGHRLAALAGLGTATSPDGTDVRSVRSVLMQIHADAPHAKIYIAGYPRLFGAFSGTCNIGSVSEDIPVLGHVHATAKITSKDAAFVDEVTRAYNAVIANAAEKARTTEGVDVIFVDPDPYFAGRRLCDHATAWIEGVHGSGSVTGGQHIEAGSFHPTAIGQREGYEKAFIAAGLTPAG